MPETAEMHPGREARQTPIPPRVVPPERILSLTETIRRARRNVLELIPDIAFRQPILSGRMGRRWHMVQDPEAMRRIFLENVENYPKAEIMLRMLRPAVGDSLFTADGESWRWQRRTVTPVFTPRHVVDLAPLMSATAERVAERFASGSNRHEIVGAMLGATFDVICDVALSGREHFDAERYGAAITRYFETVGRASLLDFLQIPGWIPRPGALMGRGAVRTMHAMVARAIAARQTHPRSARRDLLDLMLEASDEETGRRMHADALLHNLQFFIVAGHETTALALAWSLLLLALHPEIQEQASAEARAVLGALPDTPRSHPRAAGAEDLDKLALIARILDEAMRLYPPVGLLAREARHADRLAERRIQPGDLVFLPIYALHRHRLLWDEPDRFEPDRFLNAAVEGRHRFQYLPFGAGPRVCVGAGFALMQARIILATLLARFRFRLDANPLPMPVMTMTVRPDPGVFLRVDPL